MIDTWFKDGSSLLEGFGFVRDLATRYAKRLAYWRTELVIATIILWLR